jgi:endonuclease/exonuclease/phosphatase family metal-dependent hydrolase
MIKIIKWLVVTLLVLLLLIIGLVYALTFHPKDRQAAALSCPADTPLYSEDKALRVVSYNVQYMAGKDYVFFYDLLDNSGPDTKPSREAVVETLDGIAELLVELDADVLLLQELHENHITTDYQNQTDELLERLGDRYPCYAEAFYWKAGFVPIPEVMGSVGMKLVTFSKYRLEEAERVQLSLIPSDPVTQAFNLKRAILTTSLPTQNGNSWHLMNTHLDAFSQGTDTMTRQVEEVNALIQEKGTAPWLIGGDYNLLAEGQYERLDDSQRAYYNPQTELTLLHEKYPSIPSLANIQGDEPQRWYTHFPNDPAVGEPDRTIDYIFYSPQLETQNEQVIFGRALELSDHLPIVGDFKLRDE